MAVLPVDHRFMVQGDCLMVPLTPSDHPFGKIVQAGHSIAVAVHTEGQGATDPRRIVAVFHSGDRPRAAIGDLITLVGEESGPKVAGQW